MTFRSENRCAYLSGSEWTLFTQNTMLIIWLTSGLYSYSQHSIRIGIIFHVNTIQSFQNTTHVLMPYDPMVDVIASHFTSSYCHIRLGCTYDVAVQTTGRNVQRLKLSTRYTIPGNMKKKSNFRSRTEIVHIKDQFLNHSSNQKRFDRSVWSESFQYFGSIIWLNWRNIPIVSRVIFYHIILGVQEWIFLLFE